MRAAAECGGAQVPSAVACGDDVIVILIGIRSDHAIRWVMRVFFLFFHGFPPSTVCAGRGALFLFFAYSGFFFQRAACRHFLYYLPLAQKTIQLPFIRLPIDAVGIIAILFHSPTPPFVTKFIVPQLIEKINPPEKSCNVRTLRTIGQQIAVRAKVGKGLQSGA